MAVEHRLCRLDDLAPNSARRFDVDGHGIAVIRVDDEVYAIGDRCSHENVSLAEGEVDEDEMTLECWKHGSVFSLETGDALTLPATKPVPRYEARVDHGDIVVEVS
jgi:3-phenylpropionate/trans-cinnamate dioxygenase ferredoxin subunit